MPHHKLEIQTTPPDGHPSHLLAPEQILVVTIPGVREICKTVIHEMTCVADFKVVNLLHAENVNLTHMDLNTSIDKLENQWNIHLVSCDTITYRAKR